jgi:hypothetical protein
MDKWLDKHRNRILKGIFGLVAVGLYLQQNSAIADLKWEVLVLKGSVKTLGDQNLSSKIDRLIATTWRHNTSINSLEEAESRRAIAICKMFPQTKNCAFWFDVERETKKIETKEQGQTSMRKTEEDFRDWRDGYR